MSHDTLHRHLIAYDITDDHRRTHIAKTLETYGERIQYSVFIIDIRPAKLLRLRTALENLIDSATDSILICDLGTPLHAPQLTYLGRHRALITDNPLIL